MRRFVLFGLIFSAAFLSGQARAQPTPVIEWQKCLGGSTDDKAYSVVQTRDGGFAVAGYTDSQDGQVTGNHGAEDGWVVKLNSAGTIQWAKCYGDSESDYLYSIVQTSDGGYAVAGQTYSNHGEVSGNHGGGDAWVMKLDDTGKIQWSDCLGGSQADAANSIVQTSDAGFAIAGYTNSDDDEVSGNHGNSDFWVVKLSGTGALLWQKCLGGSGDEIAESIFQSSDGGFAVTGTTSSDDDGDVSGIHLGLFLEDVWVVKLDDTGAFQWQECLGGSDDDQGWSSCPTFDGGFAIAGSSQSDDDEVSGNHGNGDFWVVKLDAGGSIEWQKCLGGSQTEEPYSIIQTSDQGFAVVGYTHSNDDEVSGNFGASPGMEWVVKLNDTGAMQWQKCLGGTGGDQANSIIQIPNGNYVVAGTTGSNDSDVFGNHGGLDMWVVQLGDPPPPIISYITPDAGAPGMSVAVEIIGPTGDEEDFGDDQIYSTDSLVSLVHPSDSAYVRLGPSIVSWNGRLIQQMFLIEPTAPVNTWIDFQVTYNGSTSAPDSFHIVKPTHIGTLASSGTLPTTGRSARNTMVIDSMILQGAGTYFATALTDADPNTPGNQGYLPLRILSTGRIFFGPNTQISVTGSNGGTGSSGGNGGPGGGGGGAGYPGAGGAGFTGGGGDNDGSNGPGGASTGVASSTAYDGGTSLNGVTGGNGEQHSSGGGDDGGGGGTGHPFGTSGTNGGNSSSPAGGYGAGSAGGSTSSYTTNYGGGGGGNDSSGSAGQGTGNNSGQNTGNPMLIPLAGGSGGGAGNQTYISLFGGSQGGPGGGGGGAIELTSFADVHLSGNVTLLANGGNGGNALPQSIEPAAGGGGGSGGAIEIGARDSVDNGGYLYALGGNGGSSSNSNSNGGSGGYGRIRINGYVSKSANISFESRGNARYAGPAIQRVNFTTDSFFVHAYGEYWDSIPRTPLAVEIYWMWPSNPIWQSANMTFVNDPTSHTGGWIWGDTLSTNTQDTELYLVAVQQVADASNPPYAYVPTTGIMSHTSGIIAKVVGPPKLLVKETVLNFGDVLVDSCSQDTTIEIYSAGQSTLVVDSVKLSPAIADYKIKTSFPQSVAPGDSLAVELSFCPMSNKCPIATMLNIYSDGGDTEVALTGCGVQPQMAIHPLQINFGLVHVGDCKDTSVTVVDAGKDALTVTSETFGNPQFKIVGTLPVIVPANDSVSLNLQYCPTDTGITQTYDSVHGDAPQSPITLTLIGGGKEGILSMPNVLDLGLVHLDSCKDSVFYAKNTGNDTLLIESNPITPSGFTSSSPIFPLVLQPDSSIGIAVQFCSTDTGGFQATMTIRTDEPGADSVELFAHTGIGILSMPNIIDFGSVTTGGCKDTGIQIKNIGTDTLFLAPGMNFTAPFSYQGPAEIVLPPGATTTVTLQFCPQDTAEATETTEFDTIGHGVNQMFTLEGNGIEGALLTSGPVNIGCIALGSSDTSTVTITNTGAATLQNILAAVTPAGAATIVHNPPGTLAAGAEDSVVLIIPAQTLGNLSATLTLTWNGGTPVTVPITAQVSVPPAIALVDTLDTVVQFDSTDVGDSSVRECILITNYSCIPIPTSQIFISGGLPGEFEVVSTNASSSISDSTVVTICLKYKPLRVGNSSAHLVVVSGSDTVPIVNLSGVGINGIGIGVKLAIDTVAGRPGDIVYVPVRTLNDITAAAITSITFRVTFNPMQLDLKAPLADTTGSIQSANTPTYTTVTHSIGDKEITGTYPIPLTGTPIIAELPFEILQPTSNTAAIHLESASFGSSPSTLASASDGLIQIEQCDTDDRIALAVTPIDVAPINPNPFGGHSSVTVTVNTAGHLKIEVYNALGVKVLVPMDADVPVGTQTIVIDASSLASGAYRYATTWTWEGSNPPAYQPLTARDEKTMIVLGE